MRPTLTLPPLSPARRARWALPTQAASPLRTEPVAGTRGSRRNENAPATRTGLDISAAHALDR